MSFARDGNPEEAFNRGLKVMQSTAGTMASDYRKKLAAHERSIAMRDSRLHSLELQLQRATNVCKAKCKTIQSLETRLETSEAACVLKEAKLVMLEGSCVEKDNKIRASEASVNRAEAIRLRTFRNAAGTLRTEKALAAQRLQTIQRLEAEVKMKEAALDEARAEDSKLGICVIISQAGYPTGMYHSEGAVPLADIVASYANATGQEIDEMMVLTDTSDYDNHIVDPREHVIEPEP